jgi:hypothetical protein
MGFTRGDDLSNTPRANPYHSIVMTRRLQLCAHGDRSPAMSPTFKLQSVTLGSLRNLCKAHKPGSFLWSTTLSRRLLRW